MSRGTWTLVFNGEIYNTADLLRQLPDTVREQLVSSSDTEIVANFLVSFGSAAIPMLEGMFALVAIDSKSGMVLLGRDAFGVKPLYRARLDDSVVFSSSIYALRPFLDAPQINPGFFERMLVLDHFVGYDGQTPLAGVDSVAPGTVVHIAPDGSESIERFWSAGSRRVSVDEPSTDSIRDLLRISVENQTVADVPLSAALSGGVDSSLIAHLAAAHRSDMDFFTLDFSGSGAEFDSDGTFSELVRKHLGINEDRHHYVAQSDGWTIELVDQFVKALGTPVYDERALVWHNLYKAVHASGATVFLNGQGADEMWYGYYSEIWDWFTKLYHEPMEIDSYKLYQEDQWESSSISPILQPSIKARGEALVAELFERVSSAREHGNHEQRLTAFLVQGPLVNLLQMEDAFSMMHSVEVRVPFLSRPVADYALALSVEGHLGAARSGKDALKAAVAEWLPAAIISRPKSPLPKPAAADSSLRELLLSNLKEIASNALVRRLYAVEHLEMLANGRGNGFYGGVNEALLQVLSTWRFSEVMDV